MSKFYLSRVVVLVGLVLFATKTHGQSSSVLQRYMDANPLIQNSVDFQKVQDELDKAGNMQSGLDLPVAGILNNLKLRVSAWAIKEIKIKALSKDSIVFSVLFNNGNDTETVKTNPIFIGDLLGQNFRNILTVWCNKELITISKSISGSGSENIINFVMTQFCGNFDPSSKTKQITNDAKFRELLAKAIVESLNKKLKDAFNNGENILSTKLTDTALLNTQVLPQVTSVLNEKLDIVKQQINNALDVVISDAGDFQKKASAVLASANTGVSVSNQEAGLGGGICFTFLQKMLGKQKNGSLKVTGLVNGIVPINSSDTVSSQPITMGVQISMAKSDRFQLNVIGAYIIDNIKKGTSVSGSNSGEMGFGVMAKPADNIIIGLNGVYKFYHKTIMLDNGKSVERDDQFAAGISIQQAKSNSPIYVIGIAGNSSRTAPLTPTLQIIYPLVLNK